MVNLEQTKILFQTQNSQHINEKIDEKVEEPGFDQVGKGSFFQYRCTAFKCNETSHDSRNHFTDISIQHAFMCKTITRCKAEPQFVL